MGTAEDRHFAVGFDFGTTNSSVAIVDEARQVQLASFPSAGTETQSFRSVLYFEQYKTSEGVNRAHSLTGPAAIKHYLQTDEKGRLVQSLKSHLSSRTLTGTEVFGRRYKLEELVSRMLSDLRKHAAHQFRKLFATRWWAGRCALWARRRKRIRNLLFAIAGGVCAGGF